MLSEFLCIAMLGCAGYISTILCLICISNILWSNCLGESLKSSDVGATSSAPKRKVKILVQVDSDADEDLKTNVSDLCSVFGMICDIESPATLRRDDGTIGTLYLQIVTFGIEGDELLQSVRQKVKALAAESAESAVRVIFTCPSALVPRGAGCITIIIGNGSMSTIESILEVLEDLSK
jgi:hypothetical protein